jgi:Flp pilus assembly protein protease CpaA
MMVDDFKSQTVDMRIWFVLFLCMQLYNSFSIRFYTKFIIGMFLFCLLFSCSWKIEQKNSTSNETKQSSILQHPFGFLPSVGIALVIWYLFSDKIPIPVVDMFAIYENILTMPLFIIVCICISIFMCYRERKLYIAEKKQQLIQYSMGGGDVWVCGSWFAFLGFEKFIVIIFIALWIHALFYIIYYFFQKREVNEIRR